MVKSVTPKILLDFNLNVFQSELCRLLKTTFPLLKK